MFGPWLYYFLTVFPTCFHSYLLPWPRTTAIFFLCVALAISMSAQPLEEAWSILKAKKRDPRLARAGVSGFNKPKRTPNHPKKSHIVVARSGGKVKTIRFGQKGAKTVTESNPTGKRAKKQRSFKARHAKNIKRGPMSAAYWANKVKW